MTKSKSYSKDRICSVITTRDPDSGFKGRLIAIKAQVSEVIVVDNASKSLFLDNQLSNDELIGISLIRNKKNLGLGHALNQGMKKAIELGYEWVLLLDQDSLPQQDMIHHMVSAYADGSSTGEIAIIAPRIIELGGNKEALFLTKRSKFFYQRVSCEEVSQGNVTTVITSGSLINSEAFRVIGRFRGEFFIDYVDTDYCLRAKLRGYQILAVCGATLMHQFGARKRISRGPLTLFPSFHSPQRWYTMSRNRIAMIQDYGLKIPHWFLYEIVATVYILLRMLLTEDRKWAKIMSAARGTWDGVRGRYGPPYWSEST